MSVVLIRRGARLPAKTIKALEAAGHVPVVVDDMDDVRVLAPETDGAVVRAALRACQMSKSCENPRLVFAWELAHELLPQDKKI